ncbi:hypothetical protein [Methanococcus voltae]|uniref:Uncharacterized protein n=1 Tax=Methanococcus voltae (strain ATCC BAA-1334 / A3) TaxID=456320 RepID=D7DSF9_METV3|nr:hypothetical protein [Methanococcus voltae]MCS3901595.1 hypothetical protein [Methanococcus voltae]
MKKLFLPVLNITNLDGFEITEEWLSKNYETLKGKPVNVDHNYDKNSNYAVGHVSEIILSKTNELYAVVEVFEEIYELKNNLRGCSIEYNENTSGEEGIIRALALCFETTPKVEFAKSNGNIDVAELLASIKNEINEINEINCENSNSMTNFEEPGDKLDVIISEIGLLKDFCNKNNSLLKMIIKKSDEKNEIMASMYFNNFDKPFDESNDESFSRISKNSLKSFKNNIKDENIPNPNNKSLKSFNIDF